MSSGAVRVDTHWRYRNLQAIVLENRELRVVILPELGAKVWEFVHKPSDRNLLWHNPRVEPRPVPLGNSYDDNWSGGWDELFPNDEALVYNGESYPDHGEMWCQPWSWDVLQGRGEATVRLWRDGAVTPTRMEKRITLREGKSCLHFSHRLTNNGQTDVDFLWKLHPALAVSESCRLDIPLGRCLIPEGFRERLGESVPEFTWPIARDTQGREVDMRRIPPMTARQMDFFYGTELNEGWCALTDTDEKIGFGLAFPKDVFSTVWLFASYGGWRNLYTAILEPCTGYPLRLNEAVQSGRFSRLAPGKTLEAEVVAVAYAGLTSVTHIAPDGTVTGSSEESTKT